MELLLELAGLIAVTHEGLVASVSTCVQAFSGSLNGATTEPGHRE